VKVALSQAIHPLTGGAKSSYFTAARLAQAQGYLAQGNLEKRLRLEQLVRIGATAGDASLSECDTASRYSARNCLFRLPEFGTLREQQR
jgi:hypothetical protein